MNFVGTNGPAFVPGIELDWVECDGEKAQNENCGKSDSDNAKTDVNHMENLVKMPGNKNGEFIGMFGDVIGTVNKCKVSTQRYKIFFI